MCNEVAKPDTDDIIAGGAGGEKPHPAPVWKLSLQFLIPSTPESFAVLRTRD